MISKNKNTPVVREFSAGGAVFKHDNGNILWLVRKTVASDIYTKEYWMLAKGWIDDLPDGSPGPIASGKVRADENSLQKTAIREVEEEGGIKAKIIKKIGTIKYSFKHPTRGDILKFVTFYLMEFESDIPEGYGFETSEIKWLPYNDAFKLLSFKGEKEVLKNAQSLLPL